jgi:sulfopropanediol 3-dehydrogenase
MSTRYLKDPNPPTVEATDELRARVAEILRDIERGGLDAARRYSLQFDGWAPDDFVVSDAEFRRAEAELDDELLGHIAFAQNRCAASPRRSWPRCPSWSWRWRWARACCSATATFR